MTLKQLTKKLLELKDRGFVVSRRKGPTGIGHTFEKEMKVRESNLSIPDLGGRVELKTSRKDAGSFVTLFTFNRGVWQIPLKKVLADYGYIDENGRSALYNMVKANAVNSQGLQLRLDKIANKVHLIHAGTNLLIAEWSIFTIVGKFVNKTERLLLVGAKSRFNENGKEEFHYNKAILFSDPDPDKFMKAFEKGEIVIDVRMHRRADGSVRNHGTGIRIKESSIPGLYSTKKILF